MPRNINNSITVTNNIPSTTIPIVASRDVGLAKKAISRAILIFGAGDIRGKRELLIVLGQHWGLGWCPAVFRHWVG